MDNLHASKFTPHSYSSNGHTGRHTGAQKYTIIVPQTLHKPTKLQPNTLIQSSGVLIQAGSAEYPLLDLKYIPECYYIGYHKPTPSYTSD